MRATVSSFGPLLLGKVLDLNETQTSILSLIFKYCDDNDLPLLDLKDLATTLKFLVVGRGQAVSSRTTAACPRRRSACCCARSSCSSRKAPTSSSASPSSTSIDLLRTTPDGQGVITLLELADVMDKPRLFSTFMLWILAQLYEALPEIGDVQKPKLCFFFDEAHLLFDDASEALMDQIERTARLIRSKGVGIYFVTHAPTDVPSAVLSQLGNRVQHALRAFTPEDADALRKTVAHVPDDRVLRRRADAHVARHRRGRGHRAVAARHPDAARGDAPRRARLVAWSRSTRRSSRQRIAASPLHAKYGDDGRSRQRSRAHHRAARERPRGRGRRPRAQQMPPTTNAGLNGPA